MTKEMTYTSRPTQACLPSTEIPKNHAADFESDRYTREKLQELTTALREHCEDTKERKAQLIKLPHGTVIYNLSFRFTRRSRQVILEN